MKTFIAHLRGPLAALTLTTASLVSVPALTQSAPEPITIVVPYTPGASADLNLRLLAREVTEQTGRNITVSNVPGAGAVLGAVEVASADPDGTTLLLSIVGTHVTNELASENPPYDYRADFDPITRLWSAPLVWAVPAASEAETVEDIIAMAQETDGGLTYASPGVNSASHLVGIAISDATGATLRHVAYQGASPAIVDLRANRVDMYFSSYTAVAPHVDEGAVRILAVLDTEQMALAPDVPTTAQAGLEGIVSGIDFALLAPAGTPEETIETLRADFTAAMEFPEVIEMLTATGDTLVPTTPEELDAFINDTFESIRGILASQ